MGDKIELGPSGVPGTADGNTSNSITTSDGVQPRYQGDAASKFASKIEKLSMSTDDDNENESKSWATKFGLSRFLRKPPIPKTRVVTREYHASWLSQLTFSWISPLMSVSPCF